jgi:hypothetical protein
MTQTKAEATEIAQALTVCAEIIGTDLTVAAARVMADDLSRYAHQQVMGALTRCRREVRNRLTLADVLERLDDGRPGPQEAWAIVAPTLHDEGPTIVWTEEMAHAMGVARTCDDAVAARMAFIEAYRTNCQRARDSGTPARWTPSLGHDKGGRDGPLLAAVAAGKLLPQHVAQYLIGDTARADLLRIAAPDPEKQQALDALIRDYTSDVSSQP